MMIFPPKSPAAGLWRKLAIGTAIAASYAALAVIHTWPAALHAGSRTPLSFNSVCSAYVLAEQAKLFLVEHPFDLAAAYDPAVMSPMRSALLLSNSSLVGSLLFAPAYLATDNFASPPVPQGGVGV